MNELTYSKCEDYYIPDLVYTVPDVPLGKYAMLRETYLKEHRSAKYNHLLLSGKVISPSDRYRRASTTAIGHNDTTNDESGKCDRRTQSYSPTGMGW